MQIIQPNTPLADGEAEEKGDQLPFLTIHTLLTLAKLVQTIQSNALEENPDVPQSPKFSATPLPSTIPVAPTHARPATPTVPAAGTSAGTIFVGQPEADKKGGAA